MGERKECVKTPLSIEKLRGPLTEAWAKKFGSEPEPESISLLLAHIGLETGWKSCCNWNLGNVKAIVNGTVDWTFFTTWELVPVKVANAMQAARPDVVAILPVNAVHAKVVLKPDHPGCAFRSFDTVEDGIRVYLDTLFRRFTKCWPAVLDGDPERFAALLKSQGYYTAPLVEYQRGMVSRFDEASLPQLRSSVELYTRLAELGYHAADRNGPVLAFQKDKMSESDQDGKVGPRTRIAIRRALKAKQS